MEPRIYITGASCAGVTTLGRTLSGRLGIRHLDVDDFYWLPTDPPFTTKRPPEERVDLIREAMGDGGWVLTGSMDHWGEDLVEGVDLIVFVVTPTPVRLERLMAREKQRYGDRILPGGDMREIHLAFRTWAAQYDDPGFTGRNGARHEAWLAGRTVQVLRVDGTEAPGVLGERVVGALRWTEGR